MPTRVDATWHPFDTTARRLFLTSLSSFQPTTCFTTWMRACPPATAKSPGMVGQTYEGLATAATAVRIAKMSSRTRSKTGFFVFKSKCFKKLTSDYPACSSTATYFVNPISSFRRPFSHLDPPHRDNLGLPEPKLGQHGVQGVVLIPVHAPRDEVRHPRYSHHQHQYQKLHRDLSCCSCCCKYRSCCNTNGAQLQGRHHPLFLRVRHGCGGRWVRWSRRRWPFIAGVNLQARKTA